MLFDLESSLLILLIILGFVAAFVDSVVGGVITLPALLMFMDCQWHFPEKLFLIPFIDNRLFPRFSYMDSLLPQDDISPS